MPLPWAFPRTVATSTTPILEDPGCRADATLDATSATHRSTGAFVAAVRA
jgi:hypothetical protein